MKFSAILLIVAAVASSGGCRHTYEPALATLLLPAGRMWMCSGSSVQSVCESVRDACRAIHSADREHSSASRRARLYNSDACTGHLSAARQLFGSR